jgi:DNA/RNA-binding domain of Phe-tRNA-synthetase-like protein
MTVPFQYADTMRSEFPDLATRTLHIESIHPGADVSDAIAHFHAAADSRLQTSLEGELPEIQAWRRAFAKMGLKPTQYRCASEALLRRFRKEGDLPRLHPLIDLCNAVSLAYAIPIAVFDAARIDGGLEVRPATGKEVYETFSGEMENPECGEVIFVDGNGRAHSRRWTNRQSGHSAVHNKTTAAFIVAEALHPTAGQDLARLVAELKAALLESWPACKVAAA